MSFLYKIKAKILTIFGNIKLFPHPMFIVHDARTFKIKGHHTREIMKKIRPGDVIARGFCNYLDGYFIPKGESKCSHTGVYIGEGIVVHSVAEGVIQEDLIDFCRCDRIVILRSSKKCAIKEAIKIAKRTIGTPYDFNFKCENEMFYCHEFTQHCFPTLGIKKISKKSFGFIKSPKVYLADSFYCSPQFSIVYESSK